MGKSDNELSPKTTKFPTTVPRSNGQGALNSGGTPGNRGGSGRPSTAFRLRMQHLADQGAQALEVAKILKDPAHPLFMRALEWAAERGYGKAPQPITGPENTPLIPPGRLSDADIQAAIEAVLSADDDSD